MYLFNVRVHCTLCNEIGIKELHKQIFTRFDYRIGCVINRFELLHALGYNAHQIRDFMLSFITCL